MTKKLFSRQVTAVLVAALALPACSLLNPSRYTTTQTPAVSPTPTQPEKRVLTICLGEEPSSLYIYKANSFSMWSVLEAIYDGPVDIVNYQSVPVILEQIPNFGDQSASFQAMDVEEGDTVIDTDGYPVTLKVGVKVFPSGCTTGSCAITWDGKTTLQMDRIVANFVLKPSILWSDGSPLLASDSVYSFRLAADPASPVTKIATNQTEEYQALDERTVQWISKPGMVTRYLDDYFWIPLPEHSWKSYSAAQLQTVQEANLKPLGWGAYVIDEWVPGDHIRLVKNPTYFRASEGLPKFDVVVYRFVGAQTNNNILGLLSHECDIADQTTLWEGQYEQARQAQLDQRINLVIGMDTRWEHLDFNIKPASYDNGYNPYAGDRPDFFGDKRVRQAFAYCLNREETTRSIFNSLAEASNSYLPTNFPLYDASIKIPAYEPGMGIQLLDEVGWKDADNDPATARVARGVKGVPDGTAFSVKYITTTAELRKTFAQAMADSLSQCGIQVELIFLTKDEMYASGPEGTLFGRLYDLAEFAWGPYWEPFHREPPCFLYATSEIPTDANHWLGEFHGGVNITGYSNPDYDAACMAAQNAGLDSNAYQENEALTLTMLAEDIPSIPLFHFIKVAGSRPDLCGLMMDTSSRSDLANLETLDYGEGCNP
jgi:peptide/nickel transport system substrate-binding protein